jgi:prophage maintenance system killer protein
VSSEDTPGHPIDIAWLLDAAQRLPGDPAVLDYGALFAALARTEAVVLGRRVYEQPHHRAAALLHQLARVPALENANRLFAAATAVAYLSACGLRVLPDLREAAQLAGDAAEGKVDVRAISWVLRNWTRAV